MPTPTARVIANSGLIDHLEDLYKIAGIVFGAYLSICGVVVVLCVYAWRKQDKTIEKVISALEVHEISDDNVHDKVFTEIRRVSDKVSFLEGKGSGR